MKNNNYVFINLMPYREEIKREQIKQFSLYMLFFAIISGFILFVIYSTFRAEIDKQLSRNTYIVNANKKLSLDIQEISNLRGAIASTLAKRKVVEDLQVNRSDIVNVLNDISLNIPDGVVLNSLVQNGDKITIVGTANSNNKISNFMTSLSNTETFMNPQLIRITSNAPASRGGNVTQVRSDFSMIVTMRPSNNLNIGNVVRESMFINADPSKRVIDRIRVE